MLTGGRNIGLVEASHGARFFVLPEMHPLFGLSLDSREWPVGMRGLPVQTSQGGATRGDRGMDERRDVAIIALMLFAITCLAIFFLKMMQPSGGIFEMLFPQL